MAALTAPAAHADISIIQSLPLSGTQAATGRALNAGARLYFDWLNLDGGINGETIRLVARDDEQKVEQTVRNVRDMATIGLCTTASVASSAIAMGSRAYEQAITTACSTNCARGLK